MNFPFWSATPTPFLKDMSVDTASVRKLVERHVRLEVDGLFIGGSCGEGPWMTLQQKSDLLDTVCASAAGRIRIAVQVTDNSALRVLEAIKTLPPVDYVVVAQPYFFMRSTTERLRGFYLDILEKSPMPVCYYDRPLGPSIVSPPEEILEEIYAHPNLRMIKDSCGDARRQELALAARKQRPDLLLLNGDEFRFLDFIRRGYDGAMLGGGIINAPYVKEIFEAHQRGDAARAEALDERMQGMLMAAYGGGEGIPFWLTALKHTLVRLNVFREDIGFLFTPLDGPAREGIEKVLLTESGYLSPEA